ncbi:diguanylate cyclase domain-containing protein [Dongia rigui]|uniref:diguanylate cyclase n=1 Tax=Dongia rigui TaxID=940149 RepID=A0ABU5DTY0_9PROT|nr:diguanylate cyclase [Dongia rigui]MDY0870776.1 diguanylate cyclase [Dongia rigui]
MSQSNENKSRHSGDMARDKDLILVVDDSPTNLAIMNVVLRDIYQVITANNGSDALALAASEEPDLIILDIMMPGMDGYEICDRLKANPFTRDIPVMFVTAMDQERQEARGLALGAVDYIAKPVSPPIVMARVRNQLELKKQRDFLRRLSAIDGLTTIANRRAFEEDFDREWRRAIRLKSSIGVYLTDIDNFKSYNDAYGYLAGDDALRILAQAMSKAILRPGDLLARYSGEEFVGLMPDTDASGAAIVGERLLNAVRALSLPHAHSGTASIVTISIGVAICRPGPASDRAALFKLAGDALYAAKKGGRNQLRVFEMPTPVTTI